MTQQKDNSKTLPDFERPPVVETVLSAQFEPITSLQSVHFGVLWSRYSQLFPKTDERPPLESVFERFPEEPVSRVGLKVETFEKPPIARFWFTNEQQSEMIQVQRDRFVKNWQKQGSATDYPRYEKTIRPNFDRDFRQFAEFVRQNGFGELSVNQCEVTYVNHIVIGEGWSDLGDVEKIFTFWRNVGHLPPGPAEDLGVHIRFVIPNQSGTPIGRLHVDLRPALRSSDNRPMYVLNLTARGQIGGGLDFLDVGREWIVRSFVALTTDNMHKIWGGNNALR